MTTQRNDEPMVDPIRESAARLRQKARQAASTVKQARYDMYDSAGRVREEAKKAAAIAKKAGQELLKEAPEAAKDLKVVAKEIGKEVKQAGKATYDDIYKRMKGDKESA